MCRWGEHHTPRIFIFARKLVKSQPCCKRTGHGIFRELFSVTVFVQLVKTPPLSPSTKGFSAINVSSTSSSLMGHQSCRTGGHGSVVIPSTFCRGLYVLCFSGVAPGIFRRGLIRPTRGLKYGFQGTISAKDLQKIAFHLPTGGLACSDGGYSPLALP